MYDLYIDFFLGFLLKQQFAVIHVALLGHIILIPGKPVFASTPWFINILFLKQNANCKNSTKDNLY